LNRHNLTTARPFHFLETLEKAGGDNTLRFIKLHTSAFLQPYFAQLNGNQCVVALVNSMES
jgi:hypothetical protein